ncbi:MAG: hypothetical protein GX639_04000 [Fibrobacter sp.]|nr:hypothetical protein [Fibrobacter sp.]
MSTTDTKIPHVIVLAGDDSIGREQTRRQFMDTIQKSFDGVIIERYDSSMMTFASYTEKIITPSLFQETRIFHINHAQTLTEKELKLLDSTIKYPPTDSYVIIEVDEIKKGKVSEAGVIKTLQIKKRSASPDSGFAYHEFIKPSEYKIAEWLVAQVPRLLNRKINKQDADYLVDLVGYELEGLYSELQKIDLNLEPGEAITKSVIEEIVGASRPMTIFELASALECKNLTRALDIVDSLFATTFSGPSMVATVFKQFWAMFRIRHFAAQKPQVVKTFLTATGFKNQAQTDAGVAIGMAAGLLGEGQTGRVYPVLIASGIVKHAMNFTDDELKCICRWLLEFDTGVKSGKIAATQQNVQMFCYKVCRVSQLVKDGFAQ